MKNKMLLIFACVCMLLVICDIIGQLADGRSTYIAYFFRIASFFCVIGAFVFDGLGKRHKAIACATFCLVDALLRPMLGWTPVIFLIRYWHSNYYGILQMVFELITCVIPDAILIVYVLSQRRSRNIWVVIGIVMTLLGICSSYVYRFVYCLRGCEFGITFGLVYLFGFMGDNPIFKKRKKKTADISYLEQYKQEHGIK